MVIIIINKKTSKLSISSLTRPTQQKIITQTTITNMWQLKIRKFNNISKVENEKIRKVNSWKLTEVWMKNMAAMNSNSIKAQLISENI